MTDDPQIQKAVERHLSHRVSAWYAGSYPLTLIDEPSTEALQQLSRRKIRILRKHLRRQRAAIPEVHHLTPRIHLNLVMVGNRMIEAPLEATPEDLRQFVWFISADYREGDRKALRAFNRQLCRLNEFTLQRALIEYIEAQFCESLSHRITPNSSKNTHAPAPWEPLEHDFFIPHYVQLFQRTLGWPEAKTLDTPYPQLHQHERIIDNIHRAQNGKPRRTAADAYSGAYLDRLNSEKKEGQHGS